jgi:hypothetical protein
MLGNDPSESMHVQSNILVEVTAKYDLVACTNVHKEKVIETVTELSTGVLIMFAFSLHLEDLLLVCAVVLPREPEFWGTW